MYSNIIRIKKIDKDLFGTGIIITRNIVVTSEHVVKDEKNVDVEYFNKVFSGEIIFKNDVIALIRIDNFDFSQLYEEEAHNLLFTNQEILPNEQNWEIQGFLSEEQRPHSLTGNGLYIVSTPKERCDYEVGIIKVGTCNNYQGLSGSPVICNGRAVGLVQVQALDKTGDLGIGFTSYELFEKVLPEQSVHESTYIAELKTEGRNQCITEVNKNKASAKYIPDIFVEEDDYKEYLRFFCDPFLFIQKAIEELQSLDFSGVNRYLSGREIDFSGFSCSITPENYQQVNESLYETLDSSIEILEESDPDYRSVDTSSIEEWYVHKASFNSSMKRSMRDILRHLEPTGKRMIVLTKKAGQGKTNFLCDLTENFLVRKGIPSLYCNASNFVEKPSAQILRQLTGNGKWEIEYVKTELNRLWETEGKFVVIVIDGLNENTTLMNFGKFVEESMKELMEIPHLKVVMSTRSELFNERFPSLNPECLGKDFYHLDMTQRHNEDFNKRIFYGYLKFFNIQILNNTLWVNTYKQLTEDTLLLRFFCEVNKGKKQVYMYDIYKYSLFDMYYEMKKNELSERQGPGGDILFEKLINSILKYMIQNESFAQIPKSVLPFEEIQLLNYILESDVIFKEDIILKQGYTEESTETLSFTFDEFRDYCLTKYLVSRPDAEKIFPAIWEKMHELNWSIVEGVEKYSFFLARTKIPSLLPIIEKGTFYSSIYWDNVWNLEDNDITDDDIEKWKQQFLENGEYTTRIVRYLLARMDRTYFRKASVDLLYNNLNKLAERPGQYDRMLRTLFPVKEVDRFGNEIRKRGCAFYCDEIVCALNEKLNKTDEEFSGKDWLRLTMYLHHIMPREINRLWVKAYRNVPAQTKEILQQLANTDEAAIFVKQNLVAVVENLLANIDDPFLVELIKSTEQPMDVKQVGTLLGDLWV